jgi:hypothetical protein
MNVIHPHWAVEEAILISRKQSRQLRISLPAAEFASLPLSEQAAILVKEYPEYPYLNGHKRT